MEPRLNPLAADGAMPLPRLPRGPHGLPRKVIEDSQRARLVEAMAACIAVRGYEAVTIADVVAAAGVSRRTFYEHFEGKRDCFLAAYETIDRVVDWVEERARAAGADPRAQLEEGIGTYLELMTAAPDFARAFTVDVFAAGPEALERRAEVIERFAALLAGVAGDAGRKPGPEVLVAVVGGINELVVDRLRRGRPEEIARLKPAAVELAAAVCL
jgi:AcrR family transcriptional regulator